MLPSLNLPVSLLGVLGCPAPVFHRADVRHVLWPGRGAWPGRSAAVPWPDAAGRVPAAGLAARPGALLLLPGPLAGRRAGHRDRPSGGGEAAAVLLPGLVPAGAGPAAPARQERRPVQGECRRAAGHAAGGRVRRPAAARGRRRCLPRARAARPAGECHLDVPAGQDRGAVRPGAAAHRQAGPAQDQGRPPGHPGRPRRNRDLVGSFRDHLSRPDRRQAHRHRRLPVVRVVSHSPGHRGAGPRRGDHQRL